MNDYQIKNRQSDEIEIDFSRILQICLKRKWIICFVAVFCAVVTYLVSAFFITPLYQSSFTAYVNNNGSESSTSSGTTTSDLNASITLTYLYQDIILSRSVLMDAAKICDTDSSYEALKKRVSTSVSEDSGLITVYVLDEDPFMAARLAEAIATSAPGHVARMRDGSSMRILDDPIEPDQTYSPHIIKNTALGMVLGIILCIAVVIVVDLTYDVVSNADELVQRYHVVVIGTIPDLQEAQSHEDKRHLFRRKAGKKR